MYTPALHHPYIIVWKIKSNGENIEAIRADAYQTLVIVTETREELVIGVEQILTDEFKPLASRSSPVQSFIFKKWIK